jgi:hypothetical protein
LVKYFTCFMPREYFCWMDSNLEEKCLIIVDVKQRILLLNGQQPGRDVSNHSWCKVTNTSAVWTTILKEYSYIFDVN